ncbi:Protein of unknown function [Gryllus bimaculatus]|nr:Protein of unknown function [Gryllus bimaculatus]
MVWCSVLQGKANTGFQGFCYARTTGVRYCAVRDSGRRSQCFGLDENNRDRPWFPDLSGIVFQEARAYAWASLRHVLTNRQQGRPIIIFKICVYLHCNTHTAPEELLASQAC